MTFSRQKVFTQIINGINLQHPDLNCKKIFLLNGSFGVGKSRLCNIIEKELSITDSADAVLRLEPDDTMGYLPEFLNNAIIAFHAYTDSGLFKGPETGYNMAHYLELLNQIKLKNPELFEDFLTTYVLKSDADLFASQEFLERHTKLKEKIISDINEIFDNKGDRRLMLETPKVVAESFIVDLMTGFFDQDNFQQSIQHLINNNLRKKVVFIIDNYDHIAGSINKWLLDEFFEYCFYKTFSEFAAYNITNFPSNLKVSDIFDFRFILAGRNENVFANDNKWTRFRHLADYSVLKPMTEDEVQVLVENSGFKADNQLEKIMTVSRGIPFMVLLWLEFNSRNETEKEDSVLYLRTTESILRFYNEEQQEWIKSASFLNEFDANGLRCFHEIRRHYSAAFSFFENSPELTQRSKTGQKMLEIKPIIRDIIREAVSLESFSKAKEYISIVRTYQEIKDVFSGLTDEDVNVVRSLAYFKNFDEDNALKQAFQNDSPKAVNFIAGYPGWFERKKYTLKLKPDIAAKFAKFNKLVDEERAQDKLNLIGQVWEQYEKQLNAKMLDCQASLPTLNQEIIQLEKDSNSQKSVYEVYQKDFIEKENELIELRKKLAGFSSRHSYISSGIYLFLTVVLFFVASAFPHLFGSPENQDSVTIAQYIIRFFAVVFGIMSCVYGIKGSMIFSRKKELLELRGIIAENESAKQELQDKMKAIRDTKEEFQKKTNIVYEKLKEINNTINESQAKLLEPYI